jgi:hypothetical protein
VSHYLDELDGENSVGGPRRHRELLKARAGESALAASPTAVESVQGNVDGCLRTQIGMSFDLDSFDSLWFNTSVRGKPAPTVPMSDMDKTAIKAALKAFYRFYAYLEGGEGQAMPPEVAAEHERQLVSMKNMGARLADIGSGPKPATARHYRHRQPMTPGHSPRGSHRKRFEGIT